jgi:hypothetical protein
VKSCVQTRNVCRYAEDAPALVGRMELVPGVIATDLPVKIELLVRLALTPGVCRIAIWLLSSIEACFGKCQPNSKQSERVMCQASPHSLPGSVRSVAVINCSVFWKVQTLTPKNVK